MNKTLLKIIITIACVIALTVVALGVTFYFLAVHDAPAPDDSAYKTTYDPVPPETNAIVTLEKLVGMVKAKLEDYPELNGYMSEEEWEDFLQGKRIDFEMQVLVVTRNQEAQTLLSEAMKKPNVQFKPLFAKDGTMQTNNINGFFDINKIIKTTWQNTKDGKVVFAWDEALDNIRFMTRCGAAENIIPPYFSFALGDETNAANLLIKNIDNLEDRGVAIKTAAVLKDNTLTPDDFKRCYFRYKYAFFNGSLRMMVKEFPQEKRETLFFQYIFKPNETRQQVLDMLETMGKAIDHREQSLGIPPFPDFARMNFVQKRAYGLKPNLVGRMVLMMCFSPDDDGDYHYMLNQCARLHVIACAFALRAYWLDHGRLPDSLDELAPEYIKAVPLDIYGGKPVQYDRERGVVYSAGPKLVYGTGEFAREPNAFPSRDRYFVLLDWSAQK